MSFNKFVFYQLQLKQHLKNSSTPIEKWSVIALPLNYRLTLWVVCFDQQDEAEMTLVPSKARSLEALLLPSGSLQCSLFVSVNLLQPSDKTVRSPVYMEILHVGVLVDSLSWTPRQQRAASLEVSRRGCSSPIKSLDDWSHPSTPADTMWNGTTSQPRKLWESNFCFKPLCFWGWFVAQYITGTHILCCNMLYVFFTQWMIMLIVTQGSLATTL